MKRHTPKIRFNLLLSTRLTQRKKLKKTILSVFAGEEKSLHLLDYIFCSDEYLLEINNRFLHHDDYTDIITFDLSENSKFITGEIYISLTRVKENAVLYNVSLDDEVRRIAIHGALHLCGYLDKTPADKSLMTEKEDHYLNASI